MTFCNVNKLCAKPQNGKGEKKYHNKEAEKNLANELTLVRKREQLIPTCFQGWNLTKSPSCATLQQYGSSKRLPSRRRLVFIYCGRRIFIKPLSVNFLRSATSPESDIFQALLKIRPVLAKSLTGAFSRVFPVILLFNLPIAPARM